MWWWQGGGDIVVSEAGTKGGEGGSGAGFVAKMELVVVMPLMDVVLWHSDGGGDVHGG